MKRFILILICGLLLNAVQWYRRAEAAAAPTTTRTAPSTSPKTASSSLPAAPNIAEKEQAAALAARLISLPGSRSGPKVQEPNRILAEANRMSDEGFLIFARAIAAASGDPYAPRDSTLQTVFIRFAERNAVLAFDWLLTETALHAGEWSMTGLQVLAWWAVKDPEGAHPWMQSALRHTGLSEPAGTWLKGARRILASALAGSLPEESAAVLLGKPPANMALPNLENLLAMSLSTPSRRTSFMAALNRVAAGGEPWTSNHVLAIDVLSSISQTGGTLEEFTNICEALPGDHEKLAWTIKSSFRHFGQEVPFIAWAQPRFRDTGWISGFAVEWVQRDIAATTAWLATQPPGQFRDHAIHGMIQPLKEFEPDVAFAWAAEITDKTTRDFLCRNIYETWSRSSPEQAAEAFGALGLDFGSQGK